MFQFTASTLFAAHYNPSICSVKGKGRGGLGYTLYSYAVRGTQGFVLSLYLGIWKPELHCPEPPYARITPTLSPNYTKTSSSDYVLVTM